MLQRGEEPLAPAAGGAQHARCARSAAGRTLQGLPAACWRSAHAPAQAAQRIHPSTQQQVTTPSLSCLNLFLH